MLQKPFNPEFEDLKTHVKQLLDFNTFQAKIGIQNNTFGLLVGKPSQNIQEFIAIDFDISTFNTLSLQINKTKIFLYVNGTLKTSKNCSELMSLYGLSVETEFLNKVLYAFVSANSNALCTEESGIQMDMLRFYSYDTTPSYHGFGSLPYGSGPFGGSAPGVDAGRRRG